MGPGGPGPRPHRLQGHRFHPSSARTLATGNTQKIREPWTHCCTSVLAKPKSRYRSRAPGRERFFGKIINAVLEATPAMPLHHSLRHLSDFWPSTETRLGSHNGSPTSSTNSNAPLDEDPKRNHCACFVTLPGDHRWRASSADLSCSRSRSAAPSEGFFFASEKLERKFCTQNCTRFCTLRRAAWGFVHKKQTCAEGFLDPNDCDGPLRPRGWTVLL